MLLVHMGGRIYDPTLGRFLQADPFIQAPKNSQNYNRYSYVLNNPMSYTDPSGYNFIDNAFKKINKALGKFAPVVAIGLAIAGQGWASQGLWQASAVGFAAGGVATGSLKGAIIGAITAAAFQQIGQHFKDAGWRNDYMNTVAGENSPFFKNFISFGGNNLTSTQISQQIAAHAVVGGVASSLNGGKFGHGFLSAGVTKGIGGAFLPGGDNLTTGEIAQGTVVSVAIGGTTSKISGGKFANGAYTAAMQYLFNQTYKSLSERQERRGSIGLQARSPEHQIRARFNTVFSAAGSGFAGFGCVTTGTTCVLAVVLAADTYRQYQIGSNDNDPVYNFAQNNLGLNSTEAANAARLADYITGVVSVSAVYKGALSLSGQNVTAGTLGIMSGDIVSTINTIEQLNPKDSEN